LTFGVDFSLCKARLAEQISEVVIALVPAMGLEAVMHPQQMPTVFGLQLCPAIEAIESHHTLRFHNIAYVADAPKGGFGQPARLYSLPMPQQGQQDSEEIGVLKSLPDRQLHEVAKRILVVLGYLLDPRPNLFVVGHKVKVFSERIGITPSACLTVSVHTLLLYPLRTEPDESSGTSHIANSLLRDTTYQCLLV
jgi:hypothetical protein